MCIACGEIPHGNDTYLCMGCESKKSYVRETLNPYGGLGHLMGNDPNPNRFYQPQYMANNPNYNPYQAPLGDLGRMAFSMEQLAKQLQDGTFESPYRKFYPRMEPAEPIAKEKCEKVVDGEVIRGERKRIKHDKDD
jgi:hypothetical protein